MKPCPCVWMNFTTHLNHGGKQINVLLTFVFACLLRRVLDQWMCFDSCMSRWISIQHSHILRQLHSYWDSLYVIDACLVVTWVTIPVAAKYLLVYGEDVPKLKLSHPRMVVRLLSRQHDHYLSTRHVPTLTNRIITARAKYPRVRRPCSSLNSRAFLKTGVPPMTIGFPVKSHQWLAWLDPFIYIYM